MGLCSSTVWMEVELQSYNGVLWGYGLCSATVWMEMELQSYNGALWGYGSSAAPPCGWGWNCSRIMGLYGDMGSVAPPWDGPGGTAWEDWGGRKWDGGLCSATVRMGMEGHPYNGVVWGYGFSSAIACMVLEVQLYGRFLGVSVGSWRFPLVPLDNIYPKTSVI